MGERGRRVIWTGTVVSDAMDKTVVVRVERRFRHPLVGRVVRTHKKFLAHDAENRCRVGDKVTVAACAPQSKRKRWRVVEVVK